MPNDANAEERKESIGQEKPKVLKKISIIFSIVSGICAVISAGVYLAGYFHTKDEDARKLRNEVGYGACHLKPEPPANIVRLKAYVQEGIRYASLKEYELAAHSFEQVLEIDPNYVGANQNLGIIRVAMKDWNGAQSSFDAELKAIDCLGSISEKDRPQFAYSISGITGANANPKQTNQWLAHTEARVHYNMACAYIKQNKRQSAKAELENAASFHSIPQADVDKDHDLDPVRHDASFQPVLTSFTN